MLLLLYSLKFHRYKRSWILYPEIIPASDKVNIPLSVIIPFRNEASNLPAVLHALVSQDYPPSLFEVILVNDHSEDDSATVAAGFCLEHAHFMLLHADDREKGKKQALMKGIAKAACGYIITTDADCIMPVSWLRTIASTFQQKKADMIIGLVDISTGTGFLDQFQETEFLSLVASGAGAAARNHPIYCNGANFAYTKRVFYSVADAMKLGIISGDDTLFMHAIKKERSSRILLLKSRAAVVTTRGLNSCDQFLQQRRRWISKSFYYRDRDTIYTALLVLLVNLSLLGSGVMLVIRLNCWLFPALLATKFFTDVVFLSAFYRYYNKTIPARRFILYELIYPFYSLFVALLGLTSGFSWKGRHSGINYPAPT